MLSEMLQRQLEEFLKDFVISVLIDIGSAAIAGCSFAPQMTHIVRHGRQTVADITHRDCIAQVAENHRNQISGQLCK